MSAKKLFVEYMLNPSRLFIAAERGDLSQVRRWCLSNPCTHQDLRVAFHFAAANGHLNVVKYLREVHEAVPDSDTVVYAARNGYLKIVQYLCEVAAVDPTADNSQAIKKAAKYGHADIVEYLCGITHPEMLRLLSEDTKCGPVVREYAATAARWERRRG